MPSWAWKIGLSFRLRWNTSSKNAASRASSVAGFAAAAASWAIAGIAARPIITRPQANAASFPWNAVIQISLVESAAKLVASASLRTVSGRGIPASWLKWMVAGKSIAKPR